MWHGFRLKGTERKDLEIHFKFHVSMNLSQKVKSAKMLRNISKTKQQQSVAQQFFTWLTSFWIGVEKSWKLHNSPSHLWILIAASVEFWLNNKPDKSDRSCFAVESLAMQRYRAVQQLFQLTLFLGKREEGEEGEGGWILLLTLPWAVFTYLN